MDSLKKIIIGSLGLLGCISTASAAVTVNWGSFVSEETEFVTSVGSAVTQPPFSFELGFFQNGGPTGEPSTWRSQWQGLDDVQDYNQTVSFFSGTWNDSSNAFTGEQLTIWIHNGNFSANPNTEWAILTSDDWIVPASTDQRDEVLDFRVSEDVSNPDQNFFVADEVLVGQLDTTIGLGVNSVDKPSDSIVQTFTFVPEPSGVALLALAMTLGILKRRR